MEKIHQFEVSVFKRNRLFVIFIIGNFIQSIHFDGCDIEEYYKEHPTVHHFTYSGYDIARFIRNCGISDIPYINSFGEFYIGKLRCTIANDFG